ncbi:hypothetical protein L873DRAFT_630228 [Choiromyces venosus 120613-1]|uniref:Uncharacterized protein n=1 Tax=Choiromyces venosus 120613-1 TaxID=1336337 RepID=A0A3N4JT72_9PEZI|nr:hypothetical protein L873DRAFT_630228 [Choiromyces venosus 120613-1]
MSVGSNSVYHFHPSIFIYFLLFPVCNHIAGTGIFTFYFNFTLWSMIAVRFDSLPRYLPIWPVVCCRLSVYQIKRKEKKRKRKEGKKKSMQRLRLRLDPEIKKFRISTLKIYKIDKLHSTYLFTSVWYVCNVSMCKYEYVGYVCM